MLTRKDFIKKANELIEQYKLEINKYPDAKKLINDGLKVNVAEYGRIAHQSNPRFDEIRFRDWVERGIYE